ncbi:SMI1/KNR4 family protein [Priestia megaterium]|uniref:SMI1/KNR4 family protein n=1 Tax=Priestia megaterium TaxID=1404 RepID=UPI003A810D56
MYGKLEHRWHTYLHPGLTREEIEEFESRVGTSFPSAYKEFLSTMVVTYLIY